MAELANYTDLLVEVQTRLKAACEDPVALAALRRTGRDFCQRSNVWIKDLPAINIVANQKVYAIADLGAQADIKTIEAIFVRTAEQVTAGEKGYPLNLAVADFDPTARSLTFTDAPGTIAVTGGMVITATLLPSYNANEFPEWIMRQWPYGLAAGAAASIAVNPQNRQCFDPNNAAMLRLEYDTAIAEAIRWSDLKGRRGSQMIHKGFRMMGGCE